MKMLSRRIVWKVSIRRDSPCESIVDRKFTGSSSLPTNELNEKLTFCLLKTVAVVVVARGGYNKLYQLKWNRVDGVSAE